MDNTFFSFSSLFFSFSSLFSFHPLFSLGPPAPSVGPVFEGPDPHRGPEPPDSGLSYPKCTPGFGRKRGRIHGHKLLLASRRAKALWTYGPMYGMTDGLTDGRIDRRTDRWTDKIKVGRGSFLDFPLHIIGKSITKFYFLVATEKLNY